MGKLSPFLGSQVFLTVAAVYNSTTPVHSHPPCCSVEYPDASPRQYSYRKQERGKNGLWHRSSLIGLLFSKNYWILWILKRRWLSYQSSRCGGFPLYLQFSTAWIICSSEKKVIVTTFDNFKVFSPKIPVTHIEVLKVLVLVLCGQKIKGPRPDFV